MPAVAIIGPDGAGKTTLTRMLERSEAVPFRYLYMGINTSSSNVALPTSRLVQRMKESAGRTDGAASTRAPRSPRGGLAGAVWAGGRLVNRVAEEWFRQLLSWYYQWRGYIVLYDRHFLFDFAPGIATPRPDTLSRRVHLWSLTHLYPRPDLIIFLDAPGRVLFERKGESTPDELERRRRAFLKEGRKYPGFVTIDATRPLDEIHAEAMRHILRIARAPAPVPIPRSS